MLRTRTYVYAALSAILACLWLVTAQPAVTNAASGSAVSVPDAALDTVIRKAVNKPSGELTTEDLAKVTSLYAYQGENIRSLSGLEHAVNMGKLVLDGNPIEDFTPIAPLNKLNMLALSGTGLEDLSPLSNLTMLTQLLASGNRISDLTPLHNLQGLTDLLLGNNSIESIEPLEGLPLRWLDVSGNRITDISSLANIPTVENLYLNNNQISDISVLLKLEHLKYVNLKGNPVNDSDIVGALRKNGVKVDGGSLDDPNDAIKVSIDGKSVPFDQSPIIEDGTTLVPFRAIFEELGLTVGWDGDTKTVTGTKERFTISMQIGSTTAQLNGKPAELSLAPRIVNGSTFVPLRFIGEATGRDVTWIANARAIHIDSTFTSEIYDTLYSSKLKYEGDMQDGLPHGKGKYTFDGTLWYEGDFVEGRMEGTGKITNMSDLKVHYEGDFKNNLPNGTGRMVYSNGMSSTGDFVNSKNQGEGRRYFANGSLNYEGHFEDDVMSGPGTLWTENGDKYTGSFQNGMMFGPFKQYKNDALVYEGDMQGSYREGTGKEYKDGKLEYEGEYMFDDRNGNGKLYQNGALWYEGQFDAGMPNGLGTFYSTKDGTKEYDGDVINYERTGKGTIYYPDGSYYEGEAYKGKANGEGTLYGKDGKAAESGFFYQDAYQADPQKIKQSAEYALFDLTKSVTYQVIDGMDYEEDDLPPTQAAIILAIPDEPHFKTYQALSEKERAAFLNSFAQDHWGDVLGVNQCFVIIIYGPQVIEGTVTSYNKQSDTLKIVESPKSLADLQ